jgi:DNA-binding XRE family transcriptional regulator
MSYVIQHSSTIALPADRQGAPRSFSASRLILEKRPAPRFHMRSVPVDTKSAAPAPVVLHRDVSTRFGQRLKELRIERNLTQVRMAREFGVDRSYISDVERGRKSVSLPTMEIFALGLKLSLAELLTGV